MSLQLFNGGSQSPNSAVGELSPTAASAAVVQSIQAAVIIARQCRRDPQGCLSRVIEELKDIGFAEDALYRFPRGGQEVDGASVYLAREMAKTWGNIRSGWQQVADYEESFTVEGYSWDLETNAYKSYQQNVAKAVQRKVKGQTQWVKPDERDLRELIARVGAILERNAILSSLPRHHVEAAKQMARLTVQAQARDKNKQFLAKLLASFANELGVLQPGLEAYLGHPWHETTPEEAADLTAIGKTIKAGETNWEAVVAAKQAEPDPVQTTTTSHSDDETKALTKANFNPKEWSELTMALFRLDKVQPAVAETWLKEYASGQTKEQVLLHLSNRLNEQKEAA